MSTATVTPARLARLARHYADQLPIPVVAGIEVVVDVQALLASFDATTAAVAR